MNKILSFFFLMLGFLSADGFLLAQKSDTELFLDFKSETRFLKDYYRNTYKAKMNDEDKSLKQTINNYIDKIFLDYQSGSSENLTGLIPEIDKSFENFSNNRDKSKSDFLSKLDSYIDKWQNPDLKAKISKVAKDYDFDTDEQFQNITDLKSDIEMESTGNDDKLKQFLTIIIQDKVQLLKLKNDIAELEKSIKSKIAQGKGDKSINNELISENNKRKELIFRLINTIVNEHKMISSTDYAGEVKPSPFASETYNLLISFMDDYINLSRNIQGDPDPISLNSSLAAYMDVNLKLDSLYESMEDAQMIKKGERDDLLAKSHLWKNQIFPVLDNAVMNEFTSRNIPIVFQRDNKSDWFIKSILDFITPYQNPDDIVNQDKERSGEIREKFTEAWLSVKSKWLPALTSAKYLNERMIADIDEKIITWKSFTGKSFTFSSILIGLLILAGISIAVILFMKFRKK